MVKRIISLCVCACVLFGCNDAENSNAVETTSAPASTTIINSESETFISLSDNEITVDGVVISSDSSNAVYSANDIIYYEDGTDASYGEGTEDDMHSAKEANAHSVIHITKSGTYRLSGTLSKGQVFIDLGEDAKSDPSAVVTLVLDGIDITCDVAPAILFYNVYECGVKDESVATAYVDTSKAGANVIIEDGSSNTVNGAYVARIYKPETTDKLHKYDGAFYSKCSININGGEKGDGTLFINASNEGLDSEMHLTLNGGNIIISAQNDGINTNEDNISVTTINGGNLTINAGLGAEGDGIDSNGFIVINGGCILTSSCEKGPDGGIDADRDILINGGVVMACGNQNGAISPNSRQQFMQIMLTRSIGANSDIKVLDGEDELIKFTSIKPCTALVLSCPDFKDGHSYSINENGEEITFSFTSGFFGGINGMPPKGDGKFPEFHNMRPEVPEGLDKWLKETEIPEDIREWIETMRNMSEGFRNHNENIPNA
ncbi:MAG: carbohydrate-binding domain-containing protein [Clostridia bacterium]|nr:carbohydrate-binding domain-containing protein [Clostridia bacterium]